MCEERSVRLAVGQLENFYLHPFTYPPYYLIKDELHRGRVEICTATGEYETLVVCDDSWQDQDASVVCEELGFSPYGTFGWYRRFIVLHCATIDSRVHIYGATQQQLGSVHVGENQCHTLSPSITSYPSFPFIVFNCDLCYCR